MAITPRSFRLNPRLLIVALLAVIGAWSVVAATTSHRATIGVLQEWQCSDISTPRNQWSPAQWADEVDCLADAGSGADAYRVASEAVRQYPANEVLLNLKGFVAARNGDHATAIYDFRTGERITGSPDGIFENNIAWTTLYQTEGLSPERTERVLLQTRSLYQRSLQKGFSCERVHTGMFVEYAIADLLARQGAQHDPRVADAIARYSEMYGVYQTCWGRVVGGDELTVEELVAAAAMDAEMGRIAGVAHPTRHLQRADLAVQLADSLGMNLDRNWCARTVPVASAVDTCVELVQ